MKLQYTILYVDDVRRTLAFYQQAFGLKVKYLHEEGDYGELDTGNTTLSFSSRALLKQLKLNPQRPDARAPCFEIAFSTEDVPGAVERALSAGATLIQPAEETPWGQTVAYVADHEGFLVEICTPVTL
ncbi:MAG: VOC family protein [Enterobacteriaceae bacterium]